MAEKKKKKKSRLKRIFKNLAKVAALGTLGYGASKMFGGRRSPVSTVGQAEGINRTAYKPVHLGETFHPKGPRIPDRITDVASGAQSGPKTWRDYIPWKKGGRVGVGIAKRGYGRALMKGKK
jgi:hypothetical protein